MLPPLPVIRKTSVASSDLKCSNCIVAAMTREVDVFCRPKDVSWTNSDRQDDLLAEIIKLGEDEKHFTSIWLFFIQSKFLIKAEERLIFNNTPLRTRARSQILLTGTPSLGTQHA